MEGGPGGGDEQLTESGAVHVRQRYDWSETAPSIVAVEALASLENVDPVALATEFDTVLYEYVDPEALDAIVGNGRAGSVAITLSVLGYRLRFEGDELVVTEPDGPSSP